jgi:hypothetical protein
MGRSLRYLYYLARPDLTARHSWIAVCIGCLLLLSLDPPVLAQQSSGWSTADTPHFQYVVQANGSLSAAAFAAKYGEAAEAAFSDLTQVFNVRTTDKLTIKVFVDAKAYNDAVAATGRLEVPGIIAVADPKLFTILIPLNQFEARTPLETENNLRHAVAHILTGIASGFTVPRGFDEGIAQYVERPVVPQLARNAALVQGASQNGQLLSWSDLNRTQPPVDNPDLIAAQAYSVTDFLISRYRIPAYQRFLKVLPASSSWRDALQTAFGRSSDTIERQWRDNLPQWAAGDWRNNLMAGFDLGPAHDLLSKGNYAAAKQALAQSQQLFTEIGDRDGLKQVEAMLAQCDTGIQAEALMVQVQQALEHHVYDRAASLLTQARAQYKLLPIEQRPQTLLDTYDKLAQSGIKAGQQLNEATQRSHRWGDYPEARSAALAAGKIYAELGDTDKRTETQTLLNQIDGRQRRIVMLLGALGALTFAWLALWLWARGPSTVKWD